MNRFSATVVAAIFALASAQCSIADDALDRARALLDEAPIIDGHNDLPWVLRGAADGDAEAAQVVDPQSSDTNFQAMRDGGVGAQFWSVYVPSSLEPLDAVRQQLEQIDLARRMIDANPDDLRLALSVQDIVDAEADGRIASLLGIEGAHSFVESLGVLRMYYELGVRYATLTHLHSTSWADSATGEVRSDGLSEFGEEVIREMNRIGMIVDVAHVSDATVADVIAVAEAPVIVSHSGVRAIAAHMRNLSDESLRGIAGNGGVVMVYFIPPFVSDEARVWFDGLLPLVRDSKTEAEWSAISAEYAAEHGEAPRATLSQVADHIEYVAKVAGHDHVGIGADFYGAKAESDFVEGLEDVSRYPELFAELIRRGWSDENLAKLARGNVLRVFREVEHRAKPTR